MALLIVVTGPPGAGKLPVARALAGNFGRSVLVGGDAFFAFVARGAIAPSLPGPTRPKRGSDPGGSRGRWLRHCCQGFTCSFGCHTR